jgi:PhnB protein
LSSTTTPEPFETSIAPWLAVSDAAKAAAFYMAAFGAAELYRLEGDDGNLAVAQLSVDGAVFWVQDESGAISDGKGSRSIRLILSVEDPDSVFERAIAEGAATVSPVSEGYGWRTGRLIDPFGHEWEISRQLDS